MIYKYLPSDIKTIKPTSIGGVAGGEKFIHMGILFKFAQDVNISSTEKPYYLYGEQFPDDAAAIKAAGHELKGYFLLLVTPKGKINYI